MYLVLHDIKTEVDQQIDLIEFDDSEEVGMCLSIRTCYIESRIGFKTHYINLYKSLSFTV